MSLNSPPGSGPGFIFDIAVRGVLGRRPLGDPFSPNQRTFGPFFERVAAARDAAKPAVGTAPAVPVTRAPAPLTPSLPPGENPPLPIPPDVTGTVVPFFPGSLFWGSKGPKKRRTRKRRRRGADPEPPFSPSNPDKYGGWPGGPLCGTDSQCADYAEDHGLDPEDNGMQPGIPGVVRPEDWIRRPRGEVIQTLVGPMPDVTVPVVGAAARTVFARLFPWLYVFIPNRTADDDEILIPQPMPAPPRGPQRRPRIETHPGPPREPPMTPYYVPVPNPGPVDVPAPRPRVRPRPESLPDPATWPSAWPAPTQLPAPRPIPTPRPFPLPGFRWPMLLPFLPLLTTFRPPEMSRPVRTPLTPTNPGQLPSPVETPLAFPQPLPAPSSSCVCTDTKPKKRGKKKPREVCYRGTYVERRNGLIKRKRERVKCQ